MPRTRLIKPGFFKNDQLSECSMAARLLFAGLWCLADREGKLEDRQKLIKAEIFPHDDANISNLLDELSHVKLIDRYEIGEIKIIFIPTFLEHQRPHPSEPKSELSNKNNVVTNSHDEATKPHEKKCGIVPSPFNPSLDTLTLLPSEGLKENVLEKKDRSSIRLKSSTIEQAKEIIPRADIYSVESDWRGIDAEYPTNPDNAFLGYCRTFAKNHPELARRDKYDC